MRRLAVAAYAARSILRRRLATASALIGLALGIAIASAPWVATDSTLRGLADYYVGGVSIDLTASGSERNVVNASVAAGRVPDVARAEPLVGFGLTVNVSGDLRPVYAYWILPTFNTVLSRIGLTWSASPAAGGIVLHDSLRSAGLDIGQTVSFEDHREWRDSNGTLLKSEVWTFSRRIDGFYNATSGSAITGGASFLPAADVREAKVALNFTNYDFSGQLFLWFDRGPLVNPYDPEGSAARLVRERTLLEAALTPYQFYLLPSGGLETAVQNLAAHVRFLRIWFLPFTIPTTAIAILLGRVGFDLGLTGRRRELAVLRARGISVRGVRGFLLVETTVVSLLAALIGLGFAVLLSRIIISLPMFAPFTVNGPRAVPAEVAITLTTLGFTIGFAWLLAWLASRRALKFALSKDIVTGFRAYHEEEMSLPHRGSRDFLLVAVGVAGLVLVVLVALLGPFSEIAAWLGFPTIILAPVAPILLAVGLVRYLTRGTTKVYRALARLLRPFLGKVEPLVDKNLARAPRRASNIAMIVTFAMAFLVAMPVLTASSEAYLDEQARWGTPSDIVMSMSFFSSGRGAADLRSSEQAGAIAGVAGVTPVFEVSPTGPGTIWVFNASSYLGTVPWLEPRHLLGVDPRQLMQDLVKGDALAANPEFQRVSGLRVGDPVSLSVADLNGSVAATFTGRFAALVPTLPGMSYGPTWPQWYVDFSALPPGVIERLGRLSQLFVALTPGADSARVVASLRALFGENAYIRTSEEALRIELANPVRAGTFQYLETQSQLAAILMVLGIGLLVFSAASARRNELVTLVARGLGPQLVARLVMAEGWIVALLGILLGTCTGLLVAASVLRITSSYTWIPIPFVLPWTVVLPVLVVTAGVWAASFLGALAIQRMDVARVLKLRGG